MASSASSTSSTSSTSSSSTGMSRGVNPSIAAQPTNPLFRIAALVHGRSDVVHLEFGEPDFPTPAHIAAAAISSIADERQGYAPNNGMVWLREALAARVARVDHFAPSPQQIVLAGGGTGALAASLMNLLAPGDEVLIPDPAWPGYQMILATLGGHAVGYPLVATNGWRPDLAALEAAITPRTRVLIINSPSNPGGAVLPREEVAQLLAIAERHDLWLLSDECYDELLFSGEHVSPAALEGRNGQGRVLTIGTFSKTYAMTGWRAGWVVAPPALVPGLTLAVATQLNNLPLLVQRAAAAALSGPQECVAEMREAYRARRDLAVELLRRADLLEYTPEGAFYLLVHVAQAAGCAPTAPFDSVAFAEALVRERGIAVAPGAAFGQRASRYVRVSLASSPAELERGITETIAFAHAQRS